MDNFAELLTKLFEFYGKTITLSHIDAYHERIGFYDFLVIEEACRQVKFNNIKSLPSPNELAKECDRVRDLKASHAQRLDNAVLDSLTSGKRGDSAYLQKCKALMHKVLDKKLDSLELADEMYTLEKQHPNLGWHESANDVLAGAFARHGMKKHEIAKRLPKKPFYGA